MLIALWGVTTFQNLLRVTNRQLENLHDLVMVWLLVILGVVIIIGGAVLVRPIFSSPHMDSKVLEVTWTLIPIFILVSIASPRLLLLCQQDRLLMSPSNTIKVIGRQWRWQSELLDSSDHLLDREKLDEFRRFEYPLLLMLGKVSRMLVTRTDVLHSLGVPSLGIKLDANPGRLNATTVETSSPGLLLGSCYELCGSGHRAMPIYFMAA
jgi:cytochrome c oxidase subunit II